MGHVLHLNFLAAVDSLPAYVVYRKERKSSEAYDRSGGLIGSRLPSTTGAPEWKDYVISFSPTNGFEPFEIKCGHPVELTLKAIFESLKAHCAAEKIIHTFFPGQFLSEVAFPIKKHAEGQEEIQLQPYYLAATQEFGFLADFRFRKNDDAPFGRRVLQLSLSLDEKGRKNVDAYADRLSRIEGFIATTWKSVMSFKLPGAKNPVSFSPQFRKLEAESLKPKVYVVGKEKEHRSPYMGVRSEGPWKAIPKCPPLLFMFVEKDVEHARRLVRALRGNERNIPFDGFEKLFRLPLEISSDPVYLKDYSREEAENALARVKGPEGPTHIPILVMPNAEEAYAVHKSIFTNAGVPTQICTTEVISDDYALKWSVANIALQIFCKAGGQPWKVKPTQGKSLIIGLSQSHKFSEKKKAIEKYFAFSILTDSSGLFQSINVVGDGHDEKAYLEDLKKNLRLLLKNRTAEYEKVVLHTSFKLRYREMKVIHDVVVEAARESNVCQFAVVKVNQKNRFFAINPNANSLVPFEGSYMNLGPREYLIWFEGVFPDNPTVKKVIPGPTHLSFLRVSDDKLIGDTDILQDLVNLSGANWRGFNAKSAPVSIFFCHLVAERLQEFHTRNLPLPRIDDLKPWFL